MVGCWLGIDYKTGQYVYCANDTIKYTRTLLRMPDAQKWSAENLATIRQTPFDIHATAEPEVIFRDREAEAEAAVRPEEPVSRRRMYIKQSDIDAFGYTRGYPRCDHALRYGPNKTAKGHNDQCRARIMGELVNTAAGRARTEAATERLDRTVDEMG